MDKSIIVIAILLLSLSVLVRLLASARRREGLREAMKVIGEALVLAGGAQNDRGRSSGPHI